ncbi:magnesium-translocating P-type ATPase [Pyxidicoccus parkwayensis]|uniref:Magnesium-transporting ATPase, P-type 1 n=1 Tax=Pyxidicoccus parkwayensis TaxID=2813578 RepID=A0ABX7P426_9BACT|nr:magnesium-translocating P-type ATPase [Pyxidicoccus parkwaysis]QSQ25235.1 magnesium-translocating P-type ATPase [Pyxidicoccus parkwaysis]
MSVPKSLRWLSWFFGIVLLAAVIVASRHFSEARDFARLTENAEPWWLALAVLFQAGTYVAQGQVFRLVAKRGAFPLGLATACRLGLTKLFVDQAVPTAGLGGTLVLAAGLQRRGMSRKVVAAGVVVDLASYYAVYVLCLAAALVVTTVRGEDSPVVLLVSLVFVVFAVGYSSLLLALSGRGAREVPRRLARLGPVRTALEFVQDSDPALTRDRTLFLGTCAYQLAIVLCDAATLWVLIRALGAHGSPWGVFASFMISSLLHTVGFMPGGLGTFEAASVLTLRMVGVPVAVALAATLLFRGLTFWLPMLPGIWLSRRELGHRRPGHSEPHAEAARADEPLPSLLARLSTSPEGLSASEAERRLRVGGPNEPAATRPWTKFLEFLRASANPLVVILLVAGTASAFLGEESDAAIIGGIVLLSAGINFWQTFRSERAVKRLQGRIAPTATVRRDGAFCDVPRQQVVAGDVIRLSAGDLVPADARLLESSDLHVQQAALTGESLPAEKAAEQGALISSGPDSPALVFLGTSIVSGTATAVVFAAGRDTAFGEIVERLAARPEETEFERGARRFGMLILQTVIFLVLFILVVNVSLGRNAFESVLFSVALAVGLTPEFLPMITTVTLAQGAIRMAREKVIVKHLASMQNLGSIDVLCSDKTGTLTAGTMSLDDSLDALGATSERPLFLGHLNARFETGIRSPLDAAILERPTSGAGATPYSKVDEVPFDFDRRRLSVVVENGDGLTLITKGAPESVLTVCTSYEAGGDVHPLDDDSSARCLRVFSELSERGFRVLAVASKRVPGPRAFNASDERELSLAGFLTFADPLVDGAAQSIERLRRDGVEVKILTGDNELVTRHVCAQAGISAERIVLGHELRLMDEQALARVAEQAQVFARVSPSQKHRIIRALRAHGHVVGFLGDGINDAPSLHGADVGISVAGAVDVAREASDIILLERRLDVLHAGILAGRRAFGNIFKYLLMGTSSNFGNMFSMAGAALFLPFLPMLPTQILLNNLLYDLAQLTIPTDNVDPAWVARPQRWDISVMRRFMVLIGPVSSLFDFLTFAALLRLFHFGQSAFQTGWFIESLATQVLVLFVIRTMGRPWSNRPSVPLALTSVTVVIVGVALPYSPVAPLLKMEALPPAYLAFVALVVPTYLVLVELLKGKLLRRLMPAQTRADAVS